MAEKREYPFVIGTAGHIDHGKTSLVLALTGVDTDRLSEEKRRGMTIELGFAPLELPNGEVVSIVDVPGHEKFIRQMVAGAAGIDAVMLVVAADDGVMPQTREHLEILSLLGVQNGITVINKADLVDAEMRELVSSDAASLLRGTFLEDKPLLCVSAVTREGLPELAAALERMIEAAPVRDRSGSFFMPVDRAFHISGFGTVVTGTALRGEVGCESVVELMPEGKAAKVRSLQVHGATVDRACAGQRTAVNLSAVSLGEIKRGDVIAAKGCYSATRCLDVKLEIPSSLGGHIEHWQRVRLHVGTSDVLARVSLLTGDKLSAGGCAPAQLITEEPICTYSGASFILRSYSPLRTIGGGEILLSLGRRPNGKKARAELLTMLDGLSRAGGAPTGRLAALLEAGAIMREQELSKLLEVGAQELSSAVLAAKGKIITIKTAELQFMSSVRFEEIKAAILTALAEFHVAHPERGGAEAEEIARSAGLGDARLAKELIKKLADAKLLIIEDEKSWLPQFIPFDEEKFSGQIKKMREFAEERGYTLPTIEEMLLFLGGSDKEIRRNLDFLKEKKDVVILGGELILFSFIEDAFRKKTFNNADG